MRAIQVFLCKEFVPVRAVVALGLLGALPVQGANFTWGPTSGINDWNVPANWTPAGPPGSTGQTDTATIPATATGGINYDAAGPTFSNLTIATAGSTSLTVTLNAPLLLKGNATLGTDTATALVFIVSGSGSLTCQYSTVTLGGGQFTIEPGASGVINQNGYPATALKLREARVTVRGVARTGFAATGPGLSSTLLENARLTLDGGTLDTEGISFISYTNGLYLTSNGGQVILPYYGNGLTLGGATYSSLYRATMEMRAGTITNGGRFCVGMPNTFTDVPAVDGTNWGGLAEATLSGGVMLQQGYTAVGDGRVGHLVVSGAVFRTANDVYVGGGDYWGYKLPKTTVEVSGTLSLFDGSVTVTNALTGQSTASVNTHTDGKARFYFNTTGLWDGQRIVFTNLSAHISGLSTGVTYYVNVLNYATLKYFQVCDTPGGTSLGTVSGTGTADWVTQRARVSVGNLQQFANGSRMATGTLAIVGGTLTTDELVATNGTASVIRFEKGTLKILSESRIDTGVPLDVGNGVNEAVLALNGGPHRFENGLTINTNGVLALGGTNAIGAATVSGNLTLRTDAILDLDFNAATNDWLAVTGTVTVPSRATLRLRSLDATRRTPIVVLEASGGIIGNPAGWTHPDLDGVLHSVVVSGNQLHVVQIHRGTLLHVQ